MTSSLAQKQHRLGLPEMIDLEPKETGKLCRNTAFKERAEMGKTELRGNFCKFQIDVRNC